MVKSYICGFSDKMYFDNKKSGSKKGKRQNVSDDNDYSYRDFKIKHSKF